MSLTPGVARAGERGKGWYVPIVEKRTRRIWEGVPTFGFAEAQTDAMKAAAEIARTGKAEGLPGRMLAKVGP